MSSVSVPEQCFLYLAKGFNFVESAPANKEDLLFDTQSFIRKLEWKAYFKQCPDNGIDPYARGKDMYSHMHVTGTSHPSYKHPLLDQIKTRLLGWVANTAYSTPANNLGKNEIRGRRMLLDLINDRKIFLTKADKGGAILIFDHSVVENEIESETSDPLKYKKLDLNIDEAMEETKYKIIEEFLSQEAKGNITSKDKTLITGLNEKNNMKHNPEYRAVPPVIWPLTRYTNFLKIRSRTK